MITNCSPLTNPLGMVWVSRFIKVIKRNDKEIYLMKNVYRACDKCRYDIDIVGVNECKMNEHVWHELKTADVSYIMCCKCGKDEEYLWK